jgi:hypothetical protein
MRRRTFDALVTGAGLLLAAILIVAGGLLAWGHSFVDSQAEVYADHFIANHLKEIGGGLTYSQLSARSLAQPKNAALAAQVQLMFRGTTLRGMLLNAYAFWEMGQIALWGAIAAFAGAGLLLVLSVLGFVHLRRVSPAAEVLPRLSSGDQVTAA